MIKVPFDIEMAKKITKGEIPGKIVTRDGRDARIICWDKKDEDYPIVCLVKDEFEETIKSYTMQGVWNTDTSCTLRKNDLMLEIPEYLTYKEGDIIYCEVDNGGGDHWKWFSIIREMDCICGGPYVVSYVDYNLETPHRCGSLEFGKTSDNIGMIRLATEEEKAKFKDRLKKSNAPEVKEYLKRFFEEENSPKVSNSEKIGKNEFKPFDKVLIRDYNDEKWKPAFFWCKTKIFRTIGCNDWNQCIPYEGNEHLLGTTINPEEHD